jgi:hypothetical protein
VNPIKNFTFSPTIHLTAGFEIAPILDNLAGFGRWIFKD